MQMKTHGFSMNEKSLNLSIKAFVPETGLEPVRPNGHRILSPACLPIPPLRHHHNCL